MMVLVLLLIKKMGTPGAHRSFTPKTFNKIYKLNPKLHIGFHLTGILNCVYGRDDKFVDLGSDSGKSCKECWDFGVLFCQ